MIFRSTELFFFYFEASFLFSYLSSMSCRILKLFFFYFEASFLLSYLSSKIFEMFSFYFEESFLLSYLYSSFNLFWFSQGSGVCLLKSSSIAFALIGFSINLQNFSKSKLFILVMGWILKRPSLVGFLMLVFFFKSFFRFFCLFEVIC